MKTYDFFDKDGDLRDRRKCSRREAEVYANNFGYKFEEHKRKKNGLENE